MLVVKTIILNRVNQGFRVKKWAIAIQKNSRIGRFSGPFNNEVVGRVDFTITVHLIAENVSENKEARRDVFGHCR